MDVTPEPVDTSSTRQFDTLFGEKSYAEVSDLIAEPLRELLDDVASGRFAEDDLNVDLIRVFHLRILKDVMPDIAGRWRKKAVRVGSHYPPEHFHVDREMRELLDTFGARLLYSEEDIALQLEALAYLEAHTLHVHPFEDFNGRAVRVMVAEAMRRLDFPVLELSVERDTPEHLSYVNALRAWDNHKSLVPLCDFWRDVRFGALS
ncbi:Fic family protein [Rhodococcus pyridinivorans]|uniref:Fic family protein n=1 Tax=Rhodococcus pyridinivorans TaxID=103816 RepID=UPI00110D82AD|nr:Fic family protein [Rhodococcus pyridinivorans]